MRSPDQAAPFPTWEGHISLNGLDPHTQQSSLRTHARTPWRRPEEGGAGGGSDRPPLGLGHLRDNPERSRSTAKAGTEPALAQCPRGAARRASGTAPSPPRRGAAREASTTGGESEGCLLRRRTPPTPAGRHEADGGGGPARSGRVPHPRASQHTARRRGGVTGGPPRAGREGRLPFTMNVRPSPVAARSRPGRARHHHIDQGKHPQSRVGQSATASPEASEQISLAMPQLRGRGGRQPGRDEGRLTRTARSQREWGCHSRPRCPQRGAHGGRIARTAFPTAPRWVRDPGPGRHRESGRSERTREQAHGPQQAAQAGAGPPSRVTERPEAHHAFQRPNLSSDKSPEDSVSAITWRPKMPTLSERYTSPGDRRSSHRPRRRPRERATRTSVPKIATIAARHGAPRALWSTPGHTPELRGVRGVLPATRATQGPARISRARLGSVFGPPLVRPGHTRERRPARCDLSGRTRAHGALSDSPRGLVHKRSGQRDGGRARGPLPGTRGTGQDGPRLPAGTGGKNSAAASDGQDARGPATGPGRTPLASRPKARWVPAGRGSGLGSWGVLVDQPGQPHTRLGPESAATTSPHISLHA